MSITTTKSNFHPQKKVKEKNLPPGDNDERISEQSWINELNKLLLVQNLFLFLF